MNQPTNYVVKPTPQSRNEGVFRICLTQKIRDRLCPNAKEVIEDFA